MGWMVYKAWHSLQNFLPKGHKQFWLKVILFSLAGHITIMFLGLVNKSRKPIELTVFSKSRPVEVVFVPLYKKMAGVQKRIDTAKKAKNGKTQFVKNSVTKPVVKPNVPKKLEPKKLDIKNVEQVKKVVEPKKVETKKVEAKPKVVPKKTDLKLQEQQVVVKVPEPVVEKIVEPAVIAEPGLDEPIYIGRHDLQNLQMALELEAVIVKSWQPPLGLSNEIECTVELVVDHKGKVVNFTIKKTSGVMVYDMSVKRIFSQIVMPATIWNKTLTIVFKQ